LDGARTAGVPFRRKEIAIANAAGP